MQKFVARKHFPCHEYIFEDMSLSENRNLLTNNFKTAGTFDKYFQNLVPNLDLKVPSNFLFQTP